MKKFSIITATALCLFLAGCGAGQTADNDAGNEEVADAAFDEEQTAKDASLGQEDTAAYEDPDSLPAYTYEGGEEYLDVISDYLIEDSRNTQTDDTTDVYIPYSIVVETEDSNPDDIVVYGSFNIDGYELLNTTLVAGYGSRGDGAFHIKKNADGSYEVISADLPMVDEDEKEVFAPVDGLYERVTALSEDELGQARATAIAEYVNANGLNITQWQNYGWAPVSVLNAPPTPEEAQLYTYHSAQGYEITYDLREFSLSKSDEDDMFGKVEKSDTGTLMVIKKAGNADTDEALKAAAEAEDIAISDAVIGDNIACRRTEWNEELEDGRIFRYICYAVPVDGDALTVKIETTYKEGVSELSMEDLEREFESVLSTFAI